MSSNFKRLNTKLYKKSDSIVTPDVVYWKKLGPPVLVKEFGPIDYVDFSPIEPHYFAVTCSVRVQVYNPITKLVVKNLSRFRENAYGATFRNDGRLLCAGGEEAVVKLFDVSSKALLRLFKGHTAPVHRTFFMSGNTQLASFSDDKSTKIWDIPTEKAVLTYDDHTDYVRAGAINPVVPNILISGSYDNSIKMYDIRTNTVTLSVNHGCPIESLLFLPSGGIFLSAGGTDIKVWDTLAGGKLLGSISQHHKTITCLRLASEGKRLLSGSLDRHVKIYDVGSFNVVHTLDYPNAVLSLGVSKNDDTVVAGLVDGLVSISRREEDQTATPKVNQKISYKFDTHKLVNVDTVVYDKVKNAESKYDKHFRKFEYNKALDHALLPYVMQKTPEVTVGVMQELIRRKALARTLDNRDNKSLITIIRFIHRNISNARFTRILINATNIFLDVYQSKMEKLPFQLITVLILLNKTLKQEAELTEQLTALQGSMHMLLAASSISTENIDKVVPHNLQPSADAQKNLILTVT